MQKRAGDAKKKLFLLRKMQCGAGEGRNYSLYAMLFKIGH